jgi:hypothetical protein
LTLDDDKMFPIAEKNLAANFTNEHELICSIEQRIKIVASHFKCHLFKNLSHLNTPSRIAGAEACRSKSSEGSAPLLPEAAE